MKAADLHLSPIFLWHVLLRIVYQAHGWLTKRDNILFVALIILHVLPIWAFTHFPSQDGPAHLANATIIREYDQPDRTAFRAYYLLNKTLTPNWFGHLVLAGLMSFMPILVAEKVFLSGYVILLPISVRYAVAAVRPGSAFLAVLAFPFIYNYPLHLGFYSFAYSLPLFFFISGYWLKHREQFTFRKIVILAVFSLLLFFGHIVSLVAALLEITLLTMWQILLECRALTVKRHLSPRMLPKIWLLLRPLFAFLPAITLFAIFVLQNQRLSPGLSVSWEDKSPPTTLVNHLFSLYSLVSYEQREVWLARAVAGLFAGVIIYVLCSGQMPLRLTFWQGLFLAAAVYAIIYLVGPSEIGGGSYIQDRINLYPYLALIIWFAAHSYGRLARRCIQILAIGATIMFLGLHSLKYRELNDYLAEYLSGMPHIAPNTTVLPISLSQRGDAPDRQPLSLRIDLFVNAAGYIAAERRIVDLSNYEAGQRSFFPTRFRPDLNPAEQLHYAPLDSVSGELRALPTAILSYPQRTDGRIDYVLVWGIRDQDRAKAIPRLIFSQLQKGYDLIYASPQRGLMQLYRRKDLNIGP